MTRPDKYLLIDVGGTFLKGAAGDSAGNIIPESLRTVPVDSNGPAGEILDSFRRIVEDVSAAAGGSFSAVGMTFPGPFDYNRGVSLMTHKFAALKDLDMGALVKAIPGVGDVPVRFVHDVTCVVTGELRLGAARGLKNIAVVTLGTGLGFAYSKDGVVQKDSLGSPSSSLWNVPFRGGILEDRISKRGIMGRYAELSGKEGVSVKEIADAAKVGDAVAAEVFRETGEILGGVLGPIARDNSLEAILFGGQISRSFGLISGSLREAAGPCPSLGRIANVSDIDNAAFQGILSEILD